MTPDLFAAVLAGIAVLVAGLLVVVRVKQVRRRRRDAENIARADRRARERAGSSAVVRLGTRPMRARPPRTIPVTSCPPGRPRVLAPPSYHLAPYSRAVFDEEEERRRRRDRDAESSLVPIAFPAIDLMPTPLPDVAPAPVEFHEVDIPVTSDFFGC